MNALSLRGFAVIATVAATISGTCILSYHGLDGPPFDFVLIGIGSVLIGFFIGVGCYLVQLAKDIRSLSLRTEDLLPTEAILLKTPGSAVHFKTGRPSRFWEAVGGKLFLTTHRVVFLAHRGQPWHYRLSIPLEEIASAETCKVARAFTGGLKVQTTAGNAEIFTFGAVRDLDADLWVDSIYQARYRANPD
jgi:hypothetical protein